MSEAFQTWVAITLGALCLRAIDPDHFPDFAFLVLGVCWQLTALWVVFHVLRRAL